MVSAASKAFCHITLRGSLTTQVVAPLSVMRKKLDMGGVRAEKERMREESEGVHTH